jgi:hypothetical protein
MADENAGQEQPAQPVAENNQAVAQGGVKVHPAFFDAVNAYLAVSDEQTRKFGVKEAAMAMNYAAARHSAHMFLVSVKPINAAGERKDFLDYMSTMYRRMLNEHLDGLGQERNIDVGESELAAEYAAAGVQVGRMGQTPASDYVAAAGATPPTASDE